MTTKPTHLPNISKEMDLLDKAAEYAKTAFDQATVADVSQCHVMLAASRALISASRASISHRMASSRLLLQEAKLIEGLEKQQAQIEQQK